MATMTEQATSCLNKLLRGEIAAVETYRQAITKFAGQPEASALERISDDHIDACNRLRRHVRDVGGEPDTHSGAWGRFAKAVEGTAKAFGKAAALKALKEGEEQGVSDFESALKDNSLDAESRTLIQGTLLPNCRQHISTLDRLMAQP